MGALKRFHFILKLECFFFHITRFLLEIEVFLITINVKRLGTGKDATDANEKDWDAKTTRLKEREWFELHPQYKSILHLCGIDRLMDTMISLLAEKMGSEIPILVNQMEERKKKVGTQKYTSVDYIQFHNKKQFNLLKTYVTVCDRTLDTEKLMSLQILCK